MRIGLLSLVFFAIAVSVFAEPRDVHEFPIWSAKKVSKNPFGPPSNTKAEAAVQYNTALHLGVIGELSGVAPVTTAETTGWDIELAIFPAGSLVYSMAGRKGGKGDVIYAGPFRLAEDTPGFTTRFWGVPVNMMANCSNPWSGLVPIQGLQGLRGQPGEKGLLGERGPMGQTGPQGLPGKNDKSGFRLHWWIVPVAVGILVGGYYFHNRGHCTPVMAVPCVGSCIIRTNCSRCFGCRIWRGTHP